MILETMIRKENPRLIRIGTKYGHGGFVYIGTAKTLLANRGDSRTKMDLATLAQNRKFADTIKAGKGIKAKSPTALKNIYSPWLPVLERQVVDAYDSTDPQAPAVRIYIVEGCERTITYTAPVDLSQIRQDKAVDLTMAVYQQAVADLLRAYRMIMKSADLSSRIRYSLDATRIEGYFRRDDYGILGHDTEGFIQEIRRKFAQEVQ